MSTDRSHLQHYDDRASDAPTWLRAWDGADTETLVHQAGDIENLGAAIAQLRIDMPDALANYDAPLVSAGTGTTLHAPHPGTGEPRAACETTDSDLMSVYEGEHIIAHRDVCGFDICQAYTAALVGAELLPSRFVSAEVLHDHD